MRLLKNVLFSIVALLIVGGAGVYSTFQYMNTPPQLVKPNYFEYYKTQDTKPEGKVAIFISGLFMPEDFKVVDFYNLALKSLQYMPWPMRNNADVDRGVVLMDTEKYYETEEFTPTHLVDMHGSDVDIDGISYTEKYQKGELTWVPPSPRIHHDHGYFLLESRPGGAPTISAKLITKARVYWYTPGKGFKNGKVPHAAGMWAVHKGAMERVEEKYGPIPYRWITAEDFNLAREAMYELLDGGADTIVLVPGGVIFSHHEVFNGSVKHAMHYIHDWEEENGKEIKVIIAPQSGDFDVMRQGHLVMLEDRLNTLPDGANVGVVVATHGMAWDRVPNEAWIQLAPPYRDGMRRDVEDLIATYDFGRTKIINAQDHFAGHVDDPEEKYMSTNEAFWELIDDDYDYAVHIPISFFAENTDTMFGHAMFNYEGFPDYDIYDVVDYPDWSVPYTKEWDVEDTKVIYNGVPVGEYNKPIIEAVFQSIDHILAQGLTLAGGAVVEAASGS